MKKSAALIFGYNQFAFEIANSLEETYKDVILYTKEEEDLKENIKYNLELFDLSDDWGNLDKDIEIKNSIAFCTLEQEDENIFLTISLRAHFKDLVIVAIASNKESVHKLKMAGANKVIPIEETVAEIIADILHKPISSKILHDILYTNGSLKIAQIEIENVEIFGDIHPAEIDWSIYEGVIVLSIMHKDLSSEFIYSSKSKHKRLKNGDMLVVVGYEADIAEFEKKVGSRKNVNWSDWSW
jgi:Trk K+ transport system NAD-binding subunit